MKTNNIIKILILFRKSDFTITNSTMRKYYKDTYQKNYENLEYYFNKKEDVFDEFFKELIFLKMYLPINTGILKNLIFLYDIKI
jgi:hypothetical protein